MEEEESGAPAAGAASGGGGGGGSVMAAALGSGPGASSGSRGPGGGGLGSSRWFFSRERLENTPSRHCGVEADKELSYRQQAANLIQDMGQRLNVYPSAAGVGAWDGQRGGRGRERVSG